MTYYTGIDVSLRSVSICVVDDKGEEKRDSHRDGPLRYSTRRSARRLTNTPDQRSSRWRECACRQPERGGAGDARAMTTA